MTVLKKNNKMMKLLSKFFVYTSIVCLPLTGCRPIKQISDTKAIQSSQTSEQKEISSVDTTVTTPSDSASVSIPIFTLVPRPGDSVAIAEYFPEYTVKSKTASIKFKVKHDTLLVTANCDSQTVIINKLRETIKSFKAEKDSLSISKASEKQVPFIPKFYKFC